MKKFTWGHGIAIFLILFIGVLITALVASQRMDHHLVVKDYYAQDIAYQERYEKEARQKAADNLDIDYDQENKVIQLNFDNQKDRISGQALLYRPSNAKMDQTIALSANTQQIDVSTLAPGRWKIILDWSEGGQTYYKEKMLFL